MTNLVFHTEDYITTINEINFKQKHLKIEYYYMQANRILLFIEYQIISNFQDLSSITIPLYAVALAVNIQPLTRRCPDWFEESRLQQWSKRVHSIYILFQINASQSVRIKRTE